MTIVHIPEPIAATGWMMPRLLATNVSPHGLSAVSATAPESKNEDRRQAHGNSGKRDHQTSDLDSDEFHFGPLRAAGDFQDPLTRLRGTPRRKRRRCQTVGCRSFIVGGVRA